MRIFINDEPRDVPAETTVAELIGQLGLGGKFVAVERNRQIVPHANYTETTLAPDDRLEIVTLTGGG